MSFSALVRLIIPFNLLVVICLAQTKGWDAKASECRRPCPQGHYCDLYMKRCMDASHRAEGDGGPKLIPTWSCQGKCASEYYCDKASNKCRRKHYKPPPPQRPG